MKAIIAFVVIFGVVYALRCALQPFAACGRCDGLGGRVGKTLILRRSTPRDCRRCSASGRRLRWGRHVWNYFARLYRDGTR